MSVLATQQPPAAPAGSVQEEPLYEVVNGQKVELPPMSIFACRIASKLLAFLEVHAATHGLGQAVGEGLFILDAQKNLRRRPDVAFVSAAKWPLNRPLPRTGDWETIPDLAVEVVSPNDVFNEVLAKMREYFRYGVHEVWIVLPEATEIYIYTSPTTPRVLTAADELDASPLLGRLRLQVGSLFQPQPQAAPPATTTGP